MSDDAQIVLSSFDCLPAVEQRLVAAEILRRTSQWEAEPLSDDELALAAEELFLELDRREDGQSE